MITLMNLTLVDIKSEIDITSVKLLFNHMIKYNKAIMKKHKSK